MCKKCFDINCTLLCAALLEFEDTRVVVVNTALIQHQGYPSQLSYSILTRRAFKGQVADQLNQVSLHSKRWVLVLFTRWLDFTQTATMLTGRFAAVQYG